MLMQKLLVYLTGGMFYSVPSEFIFTYILVLLRFLFGMFMVCYLFSIPYSVSIMALSVLLADYRFFFDFSHLVYSLKEEPDEE